MFGKKTRGWKEINKKAKERLRKNAEGDEVLEIAGKRRKCTGNSGDPGEEHTGTQ